MSYALYRVPSLCPLAISNSCLLSFELELELELDIVDFFRNKLSTITRKEAQGSL